MSELTAWQVWMSNNAIVVILVITLGFGALLWIGNRLLTKHVEMDNLKEKFQDEMETKKREIERSELGRVADKIEELVSQIQHLFQKQDVTVTSITHLNTRVSTLETKTGQHFVRCNEREKLVMDIKLKQDNCGGVK